MKLPEGTRKAKPPNATGLIQNKCGQFLLAVFASSPQSKVTALSSLTARERNHVRECDRQVDAAGFIWCFVTWAGASVQPPPASSIMTMSASLEIHVVASNTQRAAFSRRA